MRTTDRKVSTRGLAQRPDFRAQPKHIQFWWRVHVQSCDRRVLLNLLTITEYAEFVAQRCHYCGRAPTPRAVAGCADHPGNGIDRVDVIRGYVCGNIVACCTLCNRMKSDLGIEVFFEHVARIVAFQASRNHLGDPRP
jgi:hypothetical protein